MAKADTLVLDKTGTITKGKPEVVAQEKFLEFDPAIVAAVVAHSNHPISKGVARYLKVEKTIEPQSFKEIKAKGIEAKVLGHEVVAGSVEFLKEKGIVVEYEGENSVFAVAIDGKLAVIYELADELKERAAEAIVKIKELGLDVIMLTGDNEKTAKKIAQILAIEYRAKLLPHQKAEFVDELHKKGKIVVMAGDGINDSVALARSDIAIAMGSGADIAVSVSDVVLLDESPMKIYEALRLSRRVFLAVKENLALSLLYNTVAVPLAIMGYVNPLFAALAMSLSSLTVVGNSMRIKFFKEKE
jgi:Cu+-exporting ATPase